MWTRTSSAGLGGATSSAVSRTCVSVSPATVAKQRAQCLPGRRLPRQMYRYPRFATTSRLARAGTKSKKGSLGSAAVESAEARHRRVITMSNEQKVVVRQIHNYDFRA